ncbi:flagellar hook protein FlgE [Macromonas bipunctata]|uniref:flagellar hook protein FlgE n=1 Tax=Macromonas bipunctata TaxID=183670 RepID=UPI000C322802|nr:flagellar hook protein FlgE [Macromonas bipunctata]
MSFNIGLSGLNASAKNLDVIGHNIANVNTVGMKTQRAEFAELYASSLGSAGGMGLGMGTSIATVSQEFTQGNLSDTGNELDLAINGAGFFTLEAGNGERIYTRAGNFKLDELGEIVANNGAKLIDPTTGDPYKWPNGGVAAGRETTGITMDLNLDTNAKIAAPDPTTGLTDPPLKTYGTTLQVFDQQGAAINMDFYFKKTEANTWAVYAKYPEGTGDAAAPTAVPTDGGEINAAWSATDPDRYEGTDVDYEPDLKPIAYLQFDSFGKMSKMTTESVLEAAPTISKTPSPAVGTAATETRFGGFTGTNTVGSVGTLTVDVVTSTDGPDADAIFDTATGVRKSYANAKLTSGTAAFPAANAVLTSAIDNGDGTLTVSGSGNTWIFAVQSDWKPTNMAVPPAFSVSIDNIKNTSGATDSIGQLNSPEGITVDFSKITQNAQEFSVTALDQDGNPPGFLTKISVEDDGTISAKYTNGQTESMGQLKLANFRNVSGLEPSSGGYWVETKDSGGPVFGVPGSGSFGSLRGGALEESNVDLTAELVNMMTAQRNYQANSQTIKTQDQIMNTVINLK